MFIRLALRSVLGAQSYGGLFCISIEEKSMWIRTGVRRTDIEFGFNRSVSDLLMAFIIERIYSQGERGTSKQEFKVQLCV